MKIASFLNTVMGVHLRGKGNNMFENFSYIQKTTNNQIKAFKTTNCDTTYTIQKYIPAFQTFRTYQKSMLKKRKIKVINVYAVLYGMSSRMGDFGLRRSPLNCTNFNNSGRKKSGSWTERKWKENRQRQKGNGRNAEENWRDAEENGKNTEINEITSEETKRARNKSKGKRTKTEHAEGNGSNTQHPEEH